MQTTDIAQGHQANSKIWAQTPLAGPRGPVVIGRVVERTGDQLVLEVRYGYGVETQWAMVGDVQKLWSRKPKNTTN